jgi:hypothetical protein
MLTFERSQPYERMEHKTIAELAYRHWEERGRPSGTPDTDWFWAVRDFQEERIGRMAVPTNLES